MTISMKVKKLEMAGQMLSIALRELKLLSAPVRAPGGTPTCNISTLSYPAPTSKHVR